LLDLCNFLKPYHKEAKDFNTICGTPKGCFQNKGGRRKKNGINGSSKKEKRF